MSILSSIKSAASKAYSVVKNAASKVVNAANAYTSKTTSAPKPQPVTFSPPKDVTSQPSSSKVLSSPGSGSYSTPASTVSAASNSTLSLNPSVVGPAAVFSNTAIRSSTAVNNTSYNGDGSAPADAYIAPHHLGKTAHSTPETPAPVTAQSGTATQDFTARVAAAGGGAGGGGGGSWGSSPEIARAGVGGGPAMTGTLGSASSGSGAVSPGIGTEGPVKGKTLKNLKDLNPYLGNPNVFISPLSQILNNSTETPNLNETPTGNSFDAGAVNEHLNSTPSTATTINTDIERIKTEALRIKAQLDAAAVPNPVEDTPEQKQAVDASTDPFGLKQAMDTYRTQNTNLDTLMTQRQDAYNSITAINKSYQKLYSDIKDNPDLPAGLAKRRLEVLYKQSKDQLDTYSDILTQLNTAIDDQNNILNRAFNIYTNAQTQADRQEQRTIEKLNLYISTGAIGGMTDAEIRNLATATGVSASGLMHARDVKLKDQNKQDLQTVDYESGGYKYKAVMDMNTGKIVSTLGKSPVTTDTSSDTKVATDLKDLKSTTLQDFIDTVKNNPNATVEMLAPKFPEISTDLITTLLEQYNPTPTTGGTHWWSSLFGS